MCSGLHCFWPTCFLTLNESEISNLKDFKIFPIVYFQVDLVAHISYKSLLDKVNVKPENIDLNSTKIQIQERLEGQVFGGKCPTGSPYSHGYR